MDFQGIALYAPLIGAGLGLGLGGVAIAGMLWYPQKTLWTALVAVLLNIWLTGGLHLDGAMDSADGLAVSDPQRRLAVMADSRTGAFGAIALVSIFTSKLIGLSGLLEGGEQVVWLLVNIYAWSRWGQLRAIHAFPYLKSEGKGKLHQGAITRGQVWLVAGAMLASNLGFAIWQDKLAVGLLGCTVPLSLALIMGNFFHGKLGGHTGDTYGAIVEWSEALSLLVLPPLLKNLSP